MRLLSVLVNMAAAALALSACGGDDGGGMMNASGTGGSSGLVLNPSLTGCTEADPSMAVSITQASCTFSTCHGGTFPPDMRTNLVQTLGTASVGLCSGLSNTPLINQTNPSSSYFIAKLTETAPCPGATGPTAPTMMPPPANIAAALLPAGTPVPTLTSAQVQCLINLALDIGTP